MVRKCCEVKSSLLERVRRICGKRSDPSGRVRGGWRRARSGCERRFGSLGLVLSG